MAVGLLVALLAASSLAKVNGLTCLTGETTIYTSTGGCTAFTDLNAWTTQTCASGNTCYTESYTVQVASGCTYDTIVGGCSSYHCSTAESAYSTMFGTTGSGYGCEQCNSDDCNPTTAVGRTSGSTRMTVTVAGVLGAVAAAIACL
mmetsp:Transcript_46232/g.84671  ORF Transcript_46232/g.84671 Transcript_46232/m.84671 type:complete len:146 (-) Transcript_46232:113-550(-)